MAGFMTVHVACLENAQASFDRPVNKNFTNKKDFYMASDEQWRMSLWTSSCSCNLDCLEIQRQ